MHVDDATPLPLEDELELADVFEPEVLPPVLVDAPDTEPVVDPFDPEPAPEDWDDVNPLDAVFPPSVPSSPDLAVEVPQA